MDEMSSRKLAKTWPFLRYNKFKRKLQVAAEGWFSKKGFVTQEKKKYCLKSLNNWPQNIICADVTEYIRQECEQKLGPFPLHKYLHHGLSSQAMIFNLVGPLIVKKDLEPVRVIFEEVGISWPTGEISARFEYHNRTVFNEDSGQPTSVDLAISGSETGRIFVEAKLIEREFSGCSIFSGGDCDGRNPVLYGFDGCYLHHIGREYWERMEEFGFEETALGLGPICPFVSYYQFFREVLLTLKEEGYFVLLHDERNPAFWKVSTNGKESGLWPFLMESVPTKYANRIKRVTIQQLVRKIDESGCHHDWICEFKQKYGIE